MTKKMLIDATHDEETRVAVVDGNRLAEFDYESTFRKPLKGSIFLAKVTRVEPSLQAAFVNFGGNRHGFLPFSEIHPDYFRIPIADREALIAEQEAAMAAEEDEEEEDANQEGRASEGGESESNIEDMSADDEAGDIAGPELIEEIGGGNNEEAVEASAGEDESADDESSDDESEEDSADDEAQGQAQAAGHDHNEYAEEDGDAQPFTREVSPDDEHAASDEVNGNVAGAGGEDAAPGEHEGRPNRDEGGRRGRRGGRNRHRRGGGGAQHRSRRTEKYGEDESGGNGSEGGGRNGGRFSLRRKYKIQEVIKRGQIMLVQVSKEERGNKGAAVSTYLSLPGRYCVLMPNSPRGGGVSRKISNYQDRAKMREIMKDLEVPKGMSVIVRTAGVSRTKPEVKRDLDYLMRLWDNIRELTLQSSAPSLVYEEANLIKRAVRDLYGRDVDEIFVSGEEGYKQARDFMKMMIPSHVKKVVQYKEDVPLFTRYKVEAQIAEIGEPQVTLPSGGYLVINPTEALISIDVNSGKSTKERHIEETATRTNLEAAEEVARQLRMRDLGGLIVIDFIDMEDRRNNAKVERKMRESLSTDRARIQMGRISSFGLMELSRQRLNPSLTESQYESCARCSGLGRVRTADATSVMAMRAVEDEGIKGRASQIIVHVPHAVALYILNHKRKHMSEMEARYSFNIMIRVDDTVGVSGFRVEVAKTLAQAGEGGDAVEAEDDAEENEGASRDNRDNRDNRGRRDGHRDRDNNRDRGGDRNRGGDRAEGGDREAGREGGNREGNRDGNREGGREGGRRRGRRGGRRRGRRDEAGQGREGGEGHNHSHDSAGDDAQGNQNSADVAENITENNDEVQSSPRNEGRRQPRHNRNNEDRAAARSEEKSGEAGEERDFPPPVSRPSNDDRSAPVEDSVPRTRDYEKVNETSGEKKKGWWNRLGGE